MDQFAPSDLVRDDRSVRGWRDPRGKDRSRLILSGPGWTSVPVPGRIIEAAFLTRDGGALVLTSDDCPYEEGVHALWIGPDGRLRGSSDLGPPYMPGTVGNVDLAAPDQVIFSFPVPETRWGLRPALRGGLIGWLMRLLGRPRLALQRLA